MKKFPLLFVVMAATSASSHAALFYDDFSSSSIISTVNGYIGGYYGSSLNFEQWYGGSTNVVIANGSMTVSSDSQYRSAVILFEPSSFPDGAGEYSVTVDVSRYVGNTNNSGLIRVWSGSGYDLTNTSANAIFVNTQAESFTAMGNAAVSSLGSLEINETGTHTLQFTYDGTSAIGIFLGAVTAGFPFPELDYNSVSLTVIPEPSSAMLGCVAFASMLMRRKR